MMEKTKYIVEIPTPSAKRLEKDRRIVIEAHCQPDGMGKHEFPIPEGESLVEFEFAFDEFELHNPDVLDGGVHYICYIEYRNSTGSRVEKIDFNWNKLAEAEEGF